MPRTLFVTGKLAEPSLRSTLESMELDFEYEVAVLPITVAALMDTRFIAKHLKQVAGFEQIMIPGACRGDLAVIAVPEGVEVLRGPKSLKDLPAAFGRGRSLEGYGEHRVKILAEIVNAYELPLEEILRQAAYYKDSGADIIDLGCPVEGDFPEIERVVRALKGGGYTVSLDTFNTEDARKADAAGVDYLLSVNSRNLELARSLKCKVVVIPDFDGGLDSLERSMAQLDAWGVPYIVDPILSPIGFGFTESLQRYYEMRRRHPRAEMLMGLGNLTELTDADTTGMTAVMAGVITELGIGYVLTTEVISWARGAVRELDIARKLMHYACQNRVLPKHIDDGLLTIKDPPYTAYTEEELREIHSRVRDRNFRIFTNHETIYIFNNRLFIRSTDIQGIFNQLEVDDASHAFYLGKELQKAALAVQLGKQYTQEEPLRWGYLSQNPPPDSK